MTEPGRGIVVEEYAWSSDSSPRATGAPRVTSRGILANRRWIIIVGVPALAALCVSAILLGRRSQDSRMSMREAAPTARAGELTQESRLSLPAKPAADARPAQPAEALKPGAANADTPAEMLPISFIFWNRGKGNIHGKIQNLTGEQLLISISAVNEITHRSSENYLNLGPGEQKPFGSDELEMHSQDRVIFHNPLYLDQYTIVP